MGKKLLIVDDEAPIRTLLEQALEGLENYDIEMLFAANGEEALVACEEHQPDLLFLDVMMPKLDGYEVSRRLRERSATDPYIIMLSARGLQADFETAYAVGVNEYYTKPFDLDQIFEKAKQILKVD